MTRHPRRRELDVHPDYEGASPVLVPTIRSIALEVSNAS